MAHYVYRYGGLNVQTTEKLLNIQPIRFPTPLVDVNIVFDPAHSFPLHPDGVLINRAFIVPTISWRLWFHEDVGYSLLVEFPADQLVYISVNPAGDTIHAGWTAGVPFETVISHVFGNGFALVLQLRGITALHASAVVVNEQAVLFLGRTGVGKSTVCAAFAQRGYELLTDDFAALVELDGAICVQSGFNMLRLWDDTLAALQSTEATVMLRDPLRNKHFQNVDSQHRDQAVPIAGIYLLTYQCDEAVRLHGMTAVDALLRHVYLKRISRGAQRQRSLDILSRLAQQAFIRQIGRVDDLKMLPQRVQFILNDFMQSAS